MSKTNYSNCIVWPDVGEPNLFYNMPDKQAEWICDDSNYSFSLSMDDIRDIRDWCDKVLEHYNKGLEWLS